MRFVVLSSERPLKIVFAFGADIKRGALRQPKTAETQINIRGAGAINSHAPDPSIGYWLPGSLKCGGDCYGTGDRIPSGKWLRILVVGLEFGCRINRRHDDLVDICARQ